MNRIIVLTWDERLRSATYLRPTQEWDERWYYYTILCIRCQLYRLIQFTFYIVQFCKHFDRISINVYLQICSRVGFINLKFTYEWIQWFIVFAIMYISHNLK